MSWIARLDTKAATWPPIWSSTYLLVKWGLVALGGFLVFGLWLDRLGIWSIY